MNSINEELATCLENIAAKHGVVIYALNIRWTDVSQMEGKQYIVTDIETTDVRFIEPVSK